MNIEKLAVSMLISICATGIAVGLYHISIYMIESIGLIPYIIGMVVFVLFTVLLYKHLD